MKALSPLVVFLALLTSVMCGQASTTVGIVISSVPHTISKPGAYRLSKNLTMTKAGTAAITITATNVVLDLNGFTLTAGPAANVPAVFGVDIAGDNVTVRDGTIVGFGRAVNGYDGGTQHDATKLEDLTCVAPVGLAGVYLFSTNTVLRHVRVTNSTRGASTITGIVANFSCILDDCLVSDLHATGLAVATAYQLDDGASDGLYTVLMRNCVASNLTADGGANNVLGLVSGAKDTVLDGCDFFNMTGGNQSAGGGHITVKNTNFRSCGATPLSGETDGGGNTIVP